MDNKTKILGKFRLESQNSHAYFIANKFYFYKQNDNNIYTYKFKGVPSNVKIKQFDSIIKTYKQIFFTTYKHKFFTMSIPIIDEKNKEYYYNIKTYKKRKIVKGTNKIYKTQPWIIKDLRLKD